MDGLEYKLSNADGFYEQDWELAEHNFSHTQDGEEDSMIIDRDNANEINNFNVWG